VIQNDKALLHPWACYNYARAVVTAETEDRDVIDDAIGKCRDAFVFRDKIIDDLCNTLQKRFEKLQEI